MLRDPRLFPVAILCLYVLAMLRYCLARNWAQAGYWACATGLTWLVTFVIPKGP